MQSHQFLRGRKTLIKRKYNLKSLRGDRSSETHIIPSANAEWLPNAVFLLGDEARVWRDGLAGTPHRDGVPVDHGQAEPAI